MTAARETNDDRASVPGRRQERRITGTAQPGAPRSRSRRLRPSRRVALLAVAAIAAGALIVAVALLALEAPDRAVTELDSRVLRAVTALEGTQRDISSSQQTFVTALAGPPDQRAVIIADAQKLGARYNAQWREYQRVAFGSVAERRLQRQYDRLTLDAQAAGAAAVGLVDSPDTAAYEAARHRELDLSDQQVATVARIRARFYTPQVGQGIADARNSLADARAWIVAAFGAVLALGIVGSAVLLRGSLDDERVFAARDKERRREERRANLETQLQRGLEMEPAEESTYAVIRVALGMARPDDPVELLVADSSRAHFRQALSTDTAESGPGCPVTSPAECPAASSGQTRVFLSTGRLDACPFLRNRDDGAHSAACVPVSIAGITTGVIHTTGPDHETPDANELSELELVARKAGDRIGYLRVLARSETQARIDMLTGLFNRRSVDQQAHEVLERGVQFVVAFADLDHFKELNDKHGHEMGDRALRLFGRVLRDSVRPADIPARYGGEEFVVLLPECTLSDARVVAERVRERLESAVAGASVPTFTVSMGLAAWEPPEGFSDTVARADAALLHAKRSGRDRVVASTDVPTAEDASPADDRSIGSARQQTDDDAPSRSS